MSTRIVELVFGTTFSHSIKIALENTTKGMSLFPLITNERNKVQKYLKDGQLPLSTGFFLRLFVNGGPGTESPIVQIHEIEPQALSSVKLTICDGMHTYTEVIVYGDLFRELRADGILGIDQQSDLFPIIVIKELMMLPSRSVVVMSYELLCKCRKVPGNSLPPFYDRNDLNMTMPKVFAPISLGAYNFVEANTNFPRYKPPQANRVRSPHDSDSDTPVVPGTSSYGTRSAPPIPEKRYIGFHSPQHSPIPELAPSRQRAPPPPYTPSPSPLQHNPYESPKYVLETATPIADIVPGMNNWHIVGLCTSVDEVGITKRNVKAFNFEITDAAGTAIKIYAYGKNAEQLLEIVYEGQCYTVSNAIIKKVFSPIHNCTGHLYELESQGPNVVAASSASIEIPPLELNVVPVSDVNNHVNAFVDLLAVIHSVGPLINFTNKHKTACVMKDLELMDMTGSIVLFTLFGRKAREFSEHFKGFVIGIKQVRVQNHNGTIKISGARRFEINPDNNAKDELHSWYKEQEEEKTSGSASDKTALNMTSEFNAIPLRKAAEHVGKFVDVLAIVDFVYPIEKFRNSKGNECTLRKVVLVDMTNTRLTLRLWGEGAEAFSDREGFIIGIKGAEIEAYKGSIFLKDGRRDVNVPVQEVNKLYQWYKNRLQNDV